MFDIGTKYIKGNGTKKSPFIEHQIVDIHKTYNSARILFKVSYVVDHEFMGQIVRDYSVPETEIAKWLFINRDTKGA